MNQAKKNIRLLGKNIYLQILMPVEVTDRYASWMNDAETTKFIENKDNSNDMVKLKSYVGKMLHSSRNYLFGIHLNATGQHIGNIKIGNIDDKTKIADIGILIGERSVWGRGYGAEAIDLVTRYAFSKLHIKKLFAGINILNAGSLKAFTKAGYVIVKKSATTVRVENNKD